jgi:hypothetical protein
MVMVPAKVLGWWYRLRWWTPEGKAYRACQRYGAAVYERLRRDGVDDARAEEATLLAFEVLHQQYRVGARPKQVREVVMIVARTAAKEMESP